MTLLTRFLKIILLYLPLALLLVILLAVGITWQQHLISESDLRFLAQVGRTQGPAAVYAVIKAELTGEEDPDGQDGPTRMDSGSWR